MVEVPDAVVHKANAELRDLEFGDVAFPRGSGLRVEGGVTVVVVEANVDEGVYGKAERDARPRGVVVGEVGEEDHGGVVVDVEEGDLAALVAQDHERRV